MNCAFPIDSLSGFISITNPFDGVEVGTVVYIPPEGTQALIQSARDGARVCRNLSRHERARVLETCASLVERDKDAFADLIVGEAGKTIKQARKAVLRCVNTLKLSADEARRNAGEVLPFDAYGGSENRQGWFSREPLGIIVAITPYNDPLNLVRTSSAGNCWRQCGRSQAIRTRAAFGDQARWVPDRGRHAAERGVGRDGRRSARRSTRLIPGRQNCFL